MPMGLPGTTAAQEITGTGFPYQGALVQRSRNCHQDQDNQILRGILGALFGAFAGRWPVILGPNCVTQVIYQPK